MKIFFNFFCLLILLSYSVSSVGNITVAVKDEPTPENGLGWRVESLKLKVDASTPINPGILAQLKLELEGVARSYGPLIFLNSIQESSRFGNFDHPDHEVKINLRDPDLPNMRFAEIERERSYKKGESMTLEIPVEVEDSRGVLYYWSIKIIIASWINAWYPTHFGGQRKLFGLPCK